ncbi:MAG: PA14 domain-containing protein, partial [Ardenticatenaceae bacterium]
MKRFSFLLLIAALLLAMVPAAYAQEVGIEATDQTWQVRYWNNTTRSGNPVVSREETEINYASTTGSFASGVNVDGFSARYEKYLDVPAGTYRFQATVDDGVRIYVDGNLILDKWFDGAARSYTADAALTSGYHYVVVDYYENRGFAQLQFNWGPANTPPPATGPWTAEFWNNRDLSGAPTVSTSVAEVNFDWGSGAPLSGINADNFSARFKRTLNFAAGTYRFSATTDDGMRVYVAGRLVIEQWTLQASRTYSYDIYLPGGDAEVKVEYFEAAGGAVAKVRWEMIGGTPPASSEVVVDDASSGFVRGGAVSGWRSVSEGYDSHLTWTWNNQTEQPNYNWARWYPELAAGRYEVFVYIPYRYTTTTAANYWVVHRDGYTKVVVNQDANPDRWVSLGTYHFQGTE